MRSICLLMLLGLAGCSGNPSTPAPCNPPMHIDSTGECVSQPYMNRRR